MTTKQRIIQLLVQLGLTESESELYFTVYKTPNLTLKDIEKQTGYSTASVYRAFEKLKDIGLIKSSESNWRKNITAASLNVLCDRVTRQQRNLKKIELELRNLNNMMKVSDTEYEGNIEIITEKDQMIHKAFEILNHDFTQVFAYGSGERIIDLIGADAENAFVNYRKKRGKKAVVLLTEAGPYAEELNKTNELDNREMKIRVDEKNQNYISYVYGNEATIWIKDTDLGNRAVVIKDPALVKMHESMFHTLWAK